MPVRKKRTERTLTKSEQMSRVRTRDTEVERLLRRELWRRGLRYRLHAKVLGHPDLVFLRERVAVFCNVHWDSNFGDNFSFPVLSAPINASEGWAGDGGSVVSRGMCESSMVPGIPETIVIDSWAMTRAECMWVYVDVYAPGITDQSTQHPEWLEAQSVFSRDGAEADTTWLSFVGRVGNNYRYKWNLRDGNDFIYTPWDQVEYGFRFSVDGNTWFDNGQGYTIERGADWCPTTYWGTEKCPG